MLQITDLDREVMDDLRRAMAWRVFESSEPGRFWIGMRMLELDDMLHTVRPPSMLRLWSCAVGRGRGWPTVITATWPLLRDVTLACLAAEEMMEPGDERTRTLWVLESLRARAYDAYAERHGRCAADRAVDAAWSWWCHRGELGTVMLEVMTDPETM